MSTKKYNGPIMSVDEAINQAGDAQNEVPLALLPTTQEPSKSVESVPPLAAINLKGKAVETPQINPKKQKLVKATEAAPKKAKRRASFMSTMVDVEVYCYPYLTVSSVSCLKLRLTLCSSFANCHRELPEFGLAALGPLATRGPRKRGFTRETQKKRKKLPSLRLLWFELNLLDNPFRMLWQGSWMSYRLRREWASLLPGQRAGLLRLGASHLTIIKKEAPGRRDDRAEFRTNNRGGCTG